MYLVDPRSDGGVRLSPIIPKVWRRDRPAEELTEPQSVARQILPTVYWHNAYVDLIRPSTILEQKCCMGRRCLSFCMSSEDNVDIDTPEQWMDAEKKKKLELS